MLFYILLLELCPVSLVRCFCRQQESLQYFQRAAELIIEEQKELRRQNAIPVDALAAAASPKNLFYSMASFVCSIASSSILSEANMHLSP